MGVITNPRVRRGEGEHKREERRRTVVCQGGNLACEGCGDGVGGSGDTCRSGDGECHALWLS